MRQCAERATCANRGSRLDGPCLCPLAIYLVYRFYPLCSIVAPAPAGPIICAVRTLGGVSCRHFLNSFGLVVVSSSLATRDATGSRRHPAPTSTRDERTSNIPRLLLPTPPRTLWQGCVSADVTSDGRCGHGWPGGGGSGCMRMGQRESNTEDASRDELDDGMRRTGTSHPPACFRIFFLEVSFWCV